MARGRRRGRPSRLMASQKIYPQRFRTAWLKISHLQSWLRAVPKDTTQAACSICVCLLSAHLNALEEHTRSHKHMKNLNLRPFEHLSEEQLDECIGHLLSKKMKKGNKREIVFKAEKSDQEETSDDDYEPPEEMRCVPGMSSDKNLIYYLESWERDPLFSGWVARVPGDIRSVRCTVCMIVLKARHQNLLVHRSSKKHLMNLTASQSSENRAEMSMGSGKELNIAGYSVKVLDPTQINLNVEPDISAENVEDPVKEVLEMVEDPFDADDNRKLKREPDTLQPHCLVCNADVSENGNIDVFSLLQVTSHRMLPPFVVLGGALKCVLDRKTVHSDTICRRCFNLLDDIDSAEVQLTKMKMDVSSQYKRTLKQIGSPWSDMFEVSLPKSINVEGQDMTVFDVLADSPRKRGRKKKVVSVPTIEEPLKKNQKKRVKLEVVQEHIITDMGDNVGPSVVSGDNTYMSLDWSQIKSEMLEEVEAVENEGVHSDEEDELDEDIEETEVEGAEAFPRIIVGKAKRYRMKTDQKDRYECPHCPKRYVSKGLLDEHVNLHTGAKPFQCRHCDVAFPMSKLLRRHLAEHNDTEPFMPYTCGQCEKAYDTPGKLEGHNRTAHGILVDSFMCDTCGKALGSRTALKAHFNMHTGERPYQCELCGSTFRLKGNLQSHVRLTHNRERRYQCDLCGRAFSRRRLLVYHTMSAHTGERPYVCPTCGAGFFISNHLSKHMKTHTGERPYNCEVCGKSFSTKDNMKLHMYTHTSVKPYECARCSSGFMRRQHLLAHIQDQHPGLDEPLAYVKHNTEIPVEENMVIVEGYEDMEPVEIPIVYQIKREKPNLGTSPRGTGTRLRKDNRRVGPVDEPVVHHLESSEPRYLVLSQM